jgi:hypothetical protein
MYAQAEDKLATSVGLGTGDSKLAVKFTLKALGSNDSKPGFKLLVVGKTNNRESIRSTGKTDDKGVLRIQLKQDFNQLRVYAFGEFVIPDAWSNVPLQKLRRTHNQELAWEAFVRPLQDVKVTGTVTMGDAEAARRAYVYFAPLDVKSTGESQVFDSPYTAYVDEDGNYEQVIPTGYYQVWCTYHDRSDDVTRTFFALVHQFDLFSVARLDLKLEESPVIEGKVVDARTGKGIAARVDAYSNRYLKRVHMGTSDGEFADEFGPNGEEIFHPVGTFKEPMYGLDPDNFMVIIRPIGKDNVIRTITGLSIDKLKDKKFVWELYTEDSSRVEVNLKTAGGNVPVFEIGIGFVPVKIDIPIHLKGEYRANAMTDEDGTVKMLGLASGTYEVFGASAFMLGTIEVKPGTAVQMYDLILKIPHITGKVTLPDGTVCTNLLAEVKVVDRGLYPSYMNPWRRNSKLQEKGQIFIPLDALDISVEVRFMAMKDGAKFAEDDWMDFKDFHLITDKKTIKVVAETCYPVELTLKANPEYKKRED